MNLVMTLGLDGLERHRLAEALVATDATEILDMASGSGVLTFAIAEVYEAKKRTCKITGIDFCAELLEIARKELPTKHFPHTTIEFEEADALHSPIADASVDAVTIGFGIRNFESRERTYAEILRVLRPGGHCFILETSHPRGLMSFLYKRLWVPMVPLIARLAGSNPQAYLHLINSSKTFPDAEALAKEMEAAGFKNVKFTRLLGGSLALHEGVKEK